MSFINYAGCQLNQVKKEITQLVKTLVKEKKTEESGLPEKKIGKTTHDGNTLQTDLHKIIYPV